MKRSGVTAGMSVGVAALLAGALPAQSAEVPFTEHVISTNAIAAQSVFATDLDGDGDTDVLSASATDNKIAWYENDGNVPPTFTEQVISINAINARSVFAIDVDGDGDTDVLSASSTDDKIAWYENDGNPDPSFTERVITEDPGPGEGLANQPYSVFALDVDGDGDIDVLSASRQDDKIAWYENDGSSDPSFTMRVITEDPDGPGGIQGFADQPWSVFAIDVDGDGDIDVLSASFDDAKVAWYENDGGSPPTFTGHVITTIGFQTVSVFAKDIDGDGDIDVISGSFPCCDLTWFESDGGSPPTFTRRIIADTGQTRSVFAADVDGDGDIDVLAPSGANDKVAWYENDGGSPPTLTERVITEDPDGSGGVEGFADRPYSAFAIDVDGDGDIDVISASFSDNKIAWYENMSPPPPPPIPTVSEWGLVVMVVLVLAVGTLVFTRHHATRV